jgi:predicted transcriptional regulator of viral defense system
LIGVPLRVFWYPESSFRAGVALITVDDVHVKIYSLEKTITDCFKYRNKIGLDIAIEALRAYRERTRKPNRAALTKFAQINRVQKVMRPYLELHCERTRYRRLRQATPAEQVAHARPPVSGTASSLPRDVSVTIRTRRSGVFLG